MSLLGFDAIGRYALAQTPPPGKAIANEDTWHQPFATDIVRRLPPYHAARQQFAAFVKASPFLQVVSADRWFVPFSEPTRFKTARQPMHTGAQQFAAFVKALPFLQVVSADRWFVPFSEPTRFRPALKTANQLFAFREEVPLSLTPNSIRATLLGTASIRGLPTSNYKRTLADNSRRIIYAATINPWSVSDRNA